MDFRGSLKTDVNIDSTFFGLEKGQDLENRAALTPTKNSQEYPPENRLKIIQFSLLCVVCKVLERSNTIMSNNSYVHSSMAFYEIAPALHSCYLFLILLVKAKTKIFNQMLSHLHFAKASILLITQFFSKSTNDMVRRRRSRINTDQFPKQALR